MVVAEYQQAIVGVQIECRQTTARSVVKIHLSGAGQVQDDIRVHRGVIVHYQAGVIQVDGLDQTGIVDDAGAM